MNLLFQHSFSFEFNCFNFYRSKEAKQIKVKQEFARKKKDVKKLKIENKRQIKMEAIGQYTRVGFTIKGTVNKRTPLTLKSSRGSQSDFFFAVLKEKTGFEMKITFWGDQALASWGLLKEGNRVYMTGLQPKKIPLAYATHGQIELTSTRGLQIQVDDEEDEDEDKDDDLTLLSNWKFPVSILKIIEKEAGTMIDALGFCYSIEEVRTVTTNKGGQVDLLKFELVDQTARIRVSAWNEEARTKLEEGQLIAIKGAKVSNWNGKSLNITGYIETNPQHTMCDVLKNWKSNTKPIVKSLFKEIKNLSDKSAMSYSWDEIPTYTISQVKQVQEKFRIRQTKPEINAFKVEARIDDVGNKLWYAKFGRLNWSLNLVLEDERGNWINAISFDEVAKKLLGNLTADEAQQLQLNDEEKFVKVIEGIKFNNSKKSHVFCIYGKENNFNSASKYLDFVVADIDPNV